MSPHSKTHHILCNGAPKPRGKKESIIRLNYLKRDKEPLNVRIDLQRFVENVNHLPPRLLDLLEIACYVFAADRNVTRGPISAVEYQSWSRRFHFHIKVRDEKFWNNTDVKEKLCEALLFMTGDESFEFTFLPGHDTPPTSLFDSEQYKINPQHPTNIILFSGGLDSLTGTIETLETTSNHVCLISHRSGQPSTRKTQDQLVKALKATYLERIKHYTFPSNLRHKRAPEESQRTRAFLFSSVAYALAYASQQDSFYFFENGITSMNFPRRGDLINSRASRTTHPKTISLLRDFLSLIEKPIDIRTPYFFKTKTDVLEALKKFRKEYLIQSSVSCSKTFQIFNHGTQCGSCYQCIDRRFAAYASDLDKVDIQTSYSSNFIQEKIKDSVAKSGILAYVHQAIRFFTSTEDRFYYDFHSELIDIVYYISGNSDEEKVGKIWELCRRHGEQVQLAIKKMRDKHDIPFEIPESDSFLQIVAEREYLKEPLDRLISSLKRKIEKAIPKAFRRYRPKDENDFNDKLSAIIDNEKEKYTQEYPAISFALCQTIPDHSSNIYDLFIESKYPRGSKSPAKLTDELGADILKYLERPETKILFVIYDPEGKIHDVGKFISDMEEREPRCSVIVIK